ncbi:MAG: hypothetical protein QUU85_13670, partial [Candidatus Eisenbacteria bacterium]|nr:hypothetical protein [Candidatus Eisenbacteria bacterium]
MQSADADRVLQAFHAGGRDCSDCHRFHDPGVILAGEARFHAGGSERQACVACHVPGRPLSLLSRGHREAASLYHADGEAFATRSASDLCLTCHGASGAVASAAATRGGASVVASLSAGAPRFREEATHPFGIEVTPGSD